MVVHHGPDCCQIGIACPGGTISDHCVAGWHCNSQDATCSRDDVDDDHGPTCCLCGEPLAATW